MIEDYSGDEMLGYFLEQQRHQGASWGINSDICATSRLHHQAVFDRDANQASRLKEYMLRKWFELSNKNVMRRTHINIGEIAITEMLEAFFVEDAFWRVVEGRHFTPDEIKGYVDADVRFELGEGTIDYQWIISAWLDAEGEIFKMLLKYIGIHSDLTYKQLEELWSNHLNFLMVIFEAFSPYERVASSVIDNGQGRLPWPKTFRGKMQKVSSRIDDANDRVRKYRDLARQEENINRLATLLERVGK